MKYLYDYGLVPEYKRRDKYTVIYDCEHIPDLVNDFVTAFIDMNGGFSSIKSELTDLTQNFCHWLYINKFTNLKLFKNDDNNEVSKNRL
jgi:hypothetical protein